ncbi:MAG: hypothetical protein GC168_17335 [Candidatus Hydrogenedens sp.]|nr:hypothetical protein [Candidatus Hydrogenedens sp.]
MENDALTPRLPAEAADLPREDIGNKAGGLIAVEVAGHHAPPWRVWTAALTAKLAAMPDADLAPILLETYNELDAGSGIIFRSSASGEDRAGSSAAGLYESLHADSPDACVAAFRSVAASGSAEHVAAYHGAHTPEPIPVIAQTFIAADVSGVAFSGHPARCRPDAFYVECVRRGAAGLVSGGHDPLKLSVGWSSLEAATEHAGAEGPEELPAAIVLQLRDALQALEHSLGTAIDLEWCHAGGTFWPLQARPVTSLRLDPALAPTEPCTSWFFDQRFPAPITPFTRSTLLPVIAEAALADALRMRGAPVPQELLVDYAGRAYAPKRIYDTMLRGAPRWWLSPDLRQIFKPDGRPPGGWLNTLGYAWCAAGAVWKERREVFRNIRAWERFCGGLNEQLLAESPPPENWGAFVAAWREWDAWTLRFLRIHRWSILWADYGYRFIAMLSARAAACISRAARLKTAEANAALAETLAAGTPEALQAFKAAYGHRSGSLDYAAPTWAELLDCGALPTPHLSAHAAPASPPLWPLAILVRLLEMREEQRFHWERILARQRSLALNLARELTRVGRIQHEDDLWFLTWDECDALMQGAAPDPDAIARRRHAHAVYHALIPPQIIGPVHDQSDTGDAAQLRGLGGAPGIADGNALLCRYPDEIPPSPEGRIIVVASLDPAWTARIAGAAGLIVERGGILSHAAILAREYGIPLVIGVDDALDRIPADARLRIDGTRGTIQLL